MAGTGAEATGGGAGASTGGAGASSSGGSSTGGASGAAGSASLGGTSGGGIGGFAGFGGRGCGPFSLEDPSNSASCPDSPPSATMQFDCEDEELVCRYLMSGGFTPCQGPIPGGPTFACCDGTWVINVTSCPP
jgi:hypothetical protein